MRRVRGPFQRRDRDGWWLEWSDWIGPRRIQRRRKYPTHTDAEAARIHIEHAINADRHMATPIPWLQAKEAYLYHLEARRLAASSQAEAARTLGRYEACCFPQATQSLTQQTIDYYLQQRSTEVDSPWTVQKDLERIKAFVRWMAARGWHDGRVAWPQIQRPKPTRHALTNDQVRALVAACPTEAWRIRLLISLTTGLRRNDVEALRVEDIDWRIGAIHTRSGKTGKTMSNRPLPDSLMPRLQAYIGSRTEGPLFGDVGVRTQWDTIRQRAGVDATRQQLRVTFNTLVKKIQSGTSAQRLLEHSSRLVNADWYTDQELLDKVTVNRLPLDEWLPQEPPALQKEERLPGDPL